MKLQVMQHIQCHAWGDLCSSLLHGKVTPMPFQVGGSGVLYAVMVKNHNSPKRRKTSKNVVKNVIDLILAPMKKAQNLGEWKKKSEKSDYHL